ncbi:MAG: hypothetical protein AB8I08_08325 [Sandaracinaceae bacterium]
MKTRWAWLCISIALSACGQPPVPVEPTGDAIVYPARVVAARGPTMAEEGGRCAIEVQHADGAYLNCRVRVRCNGDLVYGLSGAGFNHCRHDGGQIVFAHDHSGTRRDGDPRMFFDLRAGRVIISDDDPDVEVLVDLMSRPEGYGGEVGEQHDLDEPGPGDRMDDASDELAPAGEGAGSAG